MSLEEFQTWIDRKKYKPKKFKLSTGKCELCGYIRTLENHGYTPKGAGGANVMEHDARIIKLCHECHIYKVHGLSSEKFLKLTGKPLSDFLRVKT